MTISLIPTPLDIPGADTMPLRDLADALLRIGEYALLREGRCDFLFVSVRGDETVALNLQALMDAGVPRGFLTAKMSEMLSDLGATRYALLMESWVSRGEKKPGEAVPDILASEDPNREEMVLCAVEDTVLQAVAAGLIRRDPETNDPVGLDRDAMRETLEKTGSTMGGPWSGLLRAAATFH